MKIKTENLSELQKGLLILESSWIDWQPIIKKLVADSKENMNAFALALVLGKEGAAQIPANAEKHVWTAYHIGLAVGEVGRVLFNTWIVQQLSLAKFPGWLGDLLKTINLVNMTKGGKK